MVPRSQRARSFARLYSKQVTLAVAVSASYRRLRGLHDSDCPARATSPWTCLSLAIHTAQLRCCNSCSAIQRCAIFASRYRTSLVHIFFTSSLLVCGKCVCIVSIFCMFTSSRTDLLHYHLRVRNQWQENTGRHYMLTVQTTSRAAKYTSLASR